jgi:adhesin transport system membrane fusion protein
MNSMPEIPESTSKAPPQTVRGSRQIRHLSQAVMLEESGASPVIKRAVALICAAVGAFIGWSMITDVEEIAVAFGEVVPSTSVQIIQHLEGGAISEILVEEGQLVKQGQVLMRLAPISAQSELDQMRARQIGLSLRAERIKAILETRKPDFSFAGTEYRNLVADQESILGMHKVSRETNTAVLTSQINQRKAEIRQLEEQKKSQVNQLAVLSELLKIREGLEAEGLVSKVVLLDTKRSYVTTQGEVARMNEQIAVNTQMLREAENRLLNQDATARQDASNELGTVNAELAQVKEGMIKLMDRVTRLEVTAPAKGLVQDLKFRTLGAVVPPGGPLLKVVPVDDVLQVEARISTRDIGHVRPGQRVTVKMTTYDYARYGTVPGVLSSVSASSFVDEKDKNNVYFKGIVKLKKNFVGSEKGRNPILPGMTAESNIVTGDKTLLAYLLKPIHTSMQQAFHER